MHREPNTSGRPLRVLAGYNRYLNRGGEDDVFESEIALLLDGGVEVVPVTTRTTVPPSATGRLGFVRDTFWSPRWRRRFADLLRFVQPDVVHLYNVFPRFSPSVYYACADAGVPVIQAVQNYRLRCPRATFYRDGGVCELCLDRAFAWPGVRHGCYHDSALETAVVAATTALHRFVGTYRKRVDLWVAASEFSREKLITCGLPAARVVTKPNFRRRDPGAKTGSGDYALFVGRLSVEKGIPTLLDAARRAPEVPIRIAGDGPLLEQARTTAAETRAAPLEVLGRVSNDEVMAQMRGARFLIFPSEWYEGQPMTLLESFACGLPVLAARLGAPAEVVEDDVTGRHFTPGDSADLARHLSALWADDDALARYGATARRTYETRYTAEHNRTLLLDLYRRVTHAEDR